MTAATPHVPRLSIGLPVYNGERFLPAALDCYLNQTFGDFELIICDNASSDGTEQLCRAYAARDRRVHYHRNARNLGAIGNFNRTVELARAPLFKWAAHDDLCELTYLERCLEILDRHPDVVLAHSDCAFIGEGGETFDWDDAHQAYVDPMTGALQKPDDKDIGDSARPRQRFWQVLSGSRWGTHMFGVVRRSALDRTGLLANFVSSDRAMLAELALIGRFKAHPERLFKKRFHRQVSYALNQRELKAFLSTADKAYSRRARQLQAFFSAPAGKPIGVVDRAVCTGMVAVHCVKIFGQVLTMKDARNAAQARTWRQKDGVATP